MKPKKLFIGSSTGYIKLAQAFRLTFEHDKDLDVHVWPLSKWQENHSTLSSLMQHLDSYHFGVFLMTPDDRLEGPSGKPIPRDNVILELGLWLGRVGRDRTWYLVPRDQDLKLPSDLAGINTIKYRLPSPHDYQKATIHDLASLFGSARDVIHDNIEDYRKKLENPSRFAAHIRHLQSLIRVADEQEAIEIVKNGIGFLLHERSILSNSTISDTLRDVLLWTRTLLDGLDSDQLAEAQGDRIDAVWVFAPEPLEALSLPSVQSLKKTVAKNLFQQGVQYTYFVHDRAQVARICEFLIDLANEYGADHNIVARNVFFTMLDESYFLSYFTLHFYKDRLIGYQSVVRDNRDDFIVRLDEARARFVKRNLAKLGESRRPCVDMATGQLS